jgi:hypothetical protein
MKKSSPQAFLLLKRLYLAELVFIADKLSQDRKKWSYDKRSKRNIIKAIASNAKEEELTQAFEGSWGKKMPAGDTFPEAIQDEQIVFGPLGLLKSVAKRIRYEAEEISDVFTKYIRGESLLEKLITESGHRVPQEVVQLAVSKAAGSQTSPFKQLALTYFNNPQICCFVNELLAKEKVKIDTPVLYENAEFSDWVVTRYGLAIRPEDPINNLANLVGKNYEEEDLGPELKAYSGDFRTKLLEYCIMESPEAILLKMFGLPALRKIVKKLGFVSDKIENADEIVALVLLGLGFDAPPTLSGATAYLRNIEKFRRDLSKSHGADEKSGIMSRAFVEMEKVLRDLVHFHIAFLWNDILEELESDIKKEKRKLTYRQIKMEALDTLLLKKRPRVFQVDKTFERLGFGDFIGLTRRLNHEIIEVGSLRKKMAKSFGRSWILENTEVKVLDNISPHRSSFAHTKDYPGDEKCDEIVRLMGDFMEAIRSRRIYPLVMRISREVSDEYGKRYAECIEENGDRWLVYTDEYLETSQPYFVHSKTPRIAVNPVIVEKIF